ncbi:alpha/beta-hydrolase [Epithele typhae]|uniref:alpha/beta-hydrolase n=1 Tax=Epithele typhae TaxID=378194 RepID=UPI002007F644|nr:alpha/beta-hydrolase [Epithele typhae]KAH9929035.1 alpha/beta-hydrolase [Epithele typhae]
MIPSVTRLLPFVGLAASLAAAQNIVDTGYAKYRGNQSFPDTVAYLGVPYAEPPVGDLRFRAPLPLNTSRVTAESAGKIIDLTENPEFCVQGSTGAGDAGGAGSEDCLKLNIYAPAGAKKGDNLPVLVYIHGGGYVYGNPANWPYDHWIHQSPNVVIASVYYRLNSIGFLTAPEMLTNPSLGDLNAGFKDQSMALEWVSEHIDAFGGDPNKVTIDGQSAGAASIELHLVANEKPRFHGAILQSIYRTPLPQVEQQRDMFNYYSTQAGCGSGSVEKKMACLRSADISALSRAQDLVMYNFTGHYHSFHPVIDKKLFIDYPTVSLEKGHLADVPVMAGSCANETLSSGTNITAALKFYFPALTQQDLEEFLPEYPLSDFNSAAQQFQVATGESDVICGRKIVGRAAAKKNKAFTYRYNQPVNGAAATTHSSENWMMFLGTSTGFNGSTTFQPQTDADRAFAAELIAYWLSFVRAADPSAHKLARSPAWPPYTAASPMRIVLNEPADKSTTVSGVTTELEPELEGKRCAFVQTKALHQQA